MRGTILYGAGDVRFEELPSATIDAPTDAVIRLSATCVCGSDLWSYRGIQKLAQPMPSGHGYCGIVEEVGSAVRSVKPGQFQPDNPEVVVTAYRGGNQHPRRSERHDLREPLRPGARASGR